MESVLVSASIRASYSSILANLAESTVNWFWRSNSLPRLVSSKPVHQKSRKCNYSAPSSSSSLACLATSVLSSSTLARSLPPSASQVRRSSRSVLSFSRSSSMCATQLALVTVASLRSLSRLDFVCLS